MLKTFKKGGIHPADRKISRGEEIEAMPLPTSVVIPVAQHIGTPAVAQVAKGDQVKVGQILAKATGFVSSNIHSSVSGTVTKIDIAPDNLGMNKMSFTIAVEGDHWDEVIDRSEALVKECTLEPKQIVDKIAAAGIVGLGGATFPTQVKLTPPAGKTPEFLIINGVECEPYLTADHRLMLEKAEEILVGVNILCKAIGVKKAYIGIENNKKDAITHLRAVVAGDKSYAHIAIVPLKVQYPQGGEKQLIDAVSGREVPSGALPIEVGAVVQNVGTAYAVYQAVQKNKPLFERVVTVTGLSLASPKNLLVRVGTPIKDLITFCGGVPEDTGKIINGGPMMGRSVVNLDAPVTKGTSGIITVPKDKALRREPEWCIRCAKCVSVCPMGLEPYLLAKNAKFSHHDITEANHITDCIECGSCAYTCPGALPLLDLISVGKTEVIKICRSRQAAK